MMNYAMNDLLGILKYSVDVGLAIVALLSLLFMATVFITAMIYIIWRLQEVKPDGGKRSKAEAYRVEDTGRQSGQKALE